MASLIYYKNAHNQDKKTDAPGIALVGGNVSEMYRISNNIYP